MKKYYESPEAKAMIFVSQQDLAFNFDDLEDLLQNPQTPGDATIISKEDILIPLG